MKGTPDFLPIQAGPSSCIIAFVLGFVGSMPLAGPIAILVLSRAASRRFGEAVRIGLGAAVAEGIYAGFAFWGFTSLFSEHPLLVPVSHGVTAMVLVALGIRFMVWSPRTEVTSGPSRAGTALLGFSISAFNPTLMVTWGAVVAFFYSSSRSRASALASFFFGSCAALGVGTWFVVLVAVLRKYEGKLPHAVLTWTIRLLGLALALLGALSGLRLYHSLRVSRG
jgi:threonine/homoserine/homoserine lactone efflux protein